MDDETGSGQTTGQPQPAQSQQSAPPQQSQQTQQAQQQQPAQGTMLGNGVQQPVQTGSEAPQPTQTSSFLDQIRDETIKSDPSLQSITNVEDLAKSYVHAQKLVGKDKIALPKDDNDPAWSDVLAKLGRPEDPSGYQIPKPADDSPVKLPEGMDDKFKQKAHELGLTNKQAHELFGWYVSDVVEPEFQSFDNQMEKSRQDGEKALRQEFGNAFDDKIKDAQRAVSEFGGDEVLEALTRTGLANDPNVVKMLSKIGEGLREDTVGGSSPQFGKTPDQAKQEIQSLKADKSFMENYLSARAPGHKDAVDKMNRLYADAYPEQNTG